MITPETSSERKNRLAQIGILLLLTSLLAGGALLARRNYRAGRADREGALRLATVMFVLQFVLWLSRSHLVLAAATFGLMLLAVASGLLLAGVVWMFYLAIEPWIRRRWPQAIISWSRMLSGQWRDPLIGRDILFGVAFGALWMLIFELAFIPLARTGATPPLPSTEYLIGGRQAFGQWLTQFPLSILGSLEFFFLLLGLKVLLRKDWIASIALIAIFVTLKTLQGTRMVVQVPEFILIYGILVLIVYRFGLVTLAVASFTVDMLVNLPFTADFSAWYMPASVLPLLSVVAIAGWGFYHSLGGARVWQPEVE